jgi:tetratricopeptide (TPR) repeat protein
MPKPNLEKALAHSSKALENPGMSPEQKADLLVDRAHALGRLRRFEEAQQSLNEIPPANRRTLVLLTSAQIALDAQELKFENTPSQDLGDLIANSTQTLAEITRSVQEAQSLAPDDLAVARRFNYLLARALRLQGKNKEALSEFTEVRQLYGDSPEGIAAALYEADMLRQQGDYSNALLAYRRMLEEVNPAAYRGYVVPLERLRSGTLAAFTDYVNRERFDDARVLLVRFTPLFSRAEELLLRAEMLKRWGNSLVEQTPDELWEPNENRKTGLRLLREAGMAYEAMAQLEFATDAYTAHLWEGAENYYRGHSFTHAIELLNEFLGNEPKMRNAQALLRLGQSHLALGKIPQSITAFEECIEFHPNDSATYQARIDCAKALWYSGEIEKAEALLLNNITGSALKPTSREWKDSLFELGMLLYDKSEYERAIDHLEQAIKRYEQDPRKLLAQYVVAESYRSWAEQLQDLVRGARTTSERERNGARAKELLEVALGHFVEVQRTITKMSHDSRPDPGTEAMLRNCYMLAGAVLFDLGRYNEAINAYSNVSSHYPNDPFVLETFVQIANCWRRLDRQDKARGAIQQAQTAFERLPADADFANSTALNREEWRLLLADMERW